MKVILLKDIKNTGRAHETIDVSDGHGLNFLIPKKLAIPATPSAMKRTEVLRAQAATRRTLDATLLAQGLATLAEARIVITMKANEKGHLYDAVGEPEIIEAVRKDTKVELPEGVIRLERPLKELGTFDIPVSSGEHFGKFSITIEAE